MRNVSSTLQAAPSPWRTGNTITRASSPSSGIPIDAALTGSKRTKKYLIPTTLRVIGLFWKARYISKTIQHASIISFYKPTTSGSGGCNRDDLGCVVAQYIVYTSLAHVLDYITCI